MKKLIKLYNKIFINFRDKKPQIPLKKVLVVSNTALGDTILSTPSIKTLRDSFPNIYIEFLVNKKIYSLFADFDLVNKTTIYNKKLWWLIKYSNYLKKNNFDTIFFLHSNGPQDLFIALKSKVNNILKAPNYPDKISKEFSKFIFNKCDYNKKHIIEQRLDLIRFFNPKDIYTRLLVPQQLNKNKTNDKFILGVQVGAQDKYKIWRENNYIKLFNKLNTLYPDIKLVFFGIKDEENLINNVIKNIDNKNITNLCGKTSIVNLPQKINNLNLLLTPDTGTMHLAIGLGVPTLSLFSPTDSLIFGPYQDFEKHKIIQKDGDFINNQPKKLRSQEAMDLIIVDEVLTKIKLCVA
jgi:ADP-heptose:LPS heptosyltransferase